MPNNTLPPDWITQVLTALWVIILSVWGGTVHTIKKVREGIIEKFIIREWLMDIVTSAFVGTVTYALCKYSGFNEWLTVVMVSTAAHQGTRALLALDTVATKIIKKYEVK